MNFSNYSDFSHFFRFDFSFPEWIEGKDAERNYLVQIASHEVSYVLYQNSDGCFEKAEAFLGQVNITTSYFSSLDELPDSRSFAEQVAIGEVASLLYDLVGDPLGESFVSDYWCDGSEFIGVRAVNCSIVDC